MLYQLSYSRISSPLADPRRLSRPMLRFSRADGQPILQYPEALLSARTPAPHSGSPGRPSGYPPTR